MDRPDLGSDLRAESQDTWRLGLPLVSHRDFDAVERAEIGRLARRLRLIGIMLAAAVPALFVVLVVAALSESSWVGSGLAVGVLLGGLPISVAFARNFLRRARCLRQDIKSGLVERYEGSVPRPTWSEPALIQLTRRGLVSPDSEEPQWVEVLPESGLVWRANGQRPPRWIDVAPISVAPTPEFARIAAEWVQPLPAADDVQLYYNQREMTPAEVDELTRYRRRLILRPLPMAIAVNAYVGILCALFAAEHELPTGYHGFMFLWLVVVTLLTDFEMWKRLRLSRAMQRDVQVGQVTIFRSKEEPDEEQATPSGPNLSSSMEYLPVSRLPWTTGGAPASWRITPVR